MQPNFACVSETPSTMVIVCVTAQLEIGPSVFEPYWNRIWTHSGCCCHLICSAQSN